MLVRYSQAQSILSSYLKTIRRARMNLCAHVAACRANVRANPIRALISASTRISSSLVATLRSSHGVNFVSGRKEPRIKSYNMGEIRKEIVRNIIGRFGKTAAIADKINAERSEIFNTATESSMVAEYKSLK